MEELVFELELLSAFSVEFPCSGEEAVFFHHKEHERCKVYIVAIFDYHAAHCILYSLVVITYDRNTFNF